MYTTKYRPNKLEDFIGNKQVIQPFIRWLLEWDANNKKTKCALVSGVNGVGKTLLVELLLKKHDYNICATVPDLPFWISLTSEFSDKDICKGLPYMRLFEGMGQINQEKFTFDEKRNVLLAKIGGGKGVPVVEGTLIEIRVLGTRIESGTNKIVVFGTMENLASKEASDETIRQKENDDIGFVDYKTYMKQEQEIIEDNVDLVSESESSSESEDESEESESTSDSD